MKGGLYKESFNVEGMPTTWGLTRYQNNYATKNAIVVERLLNSGAVVFGKTNVPRYLADWQTFNQIYNLVAFLVKNKVKVSEKARPKIDSRKAHLLEREFQGFSPPTGFE